MNRNPISVKDATPPEHVSEVPRPYPNRLPSLLQPVAPVPDVAGFAHDVQRERALLAMTDPAGESEAVAPLDGVHARQILLTLAEREPERRPVLPHDDQSLLDRLGGDATRSSGRVPCPAHGGRDRNLAWRWGDRGRLLLKCHSHQCTFDEIVRAVS